MPVLASLKAIFDATREPPPMPADVPPAEMRAALHAIIEQSYFAFATPHAAVSIERDITIPVVGGEIVLRLYRADAGEALLPCHVYYHGGGFFLGTLDHTDGICRLLAAELGCVVVSVDYRLGPEYRFPTAAEDAYAALLWIVQHATQIRIDPAAVSVGGGSAGGNLAAVVCQMARDRSGPSIVAQVLEIPVTDFTSSRTLDFPEEDIRIDGTKGYVSLYLRDEADARDPRASPLLAATLEHLPAALVMCAEYDQLQPEGKAYAERLEASGVSTVYRFWPGQFHGSQGFDMLIPAEAAAYQAEIVAFLRDAYRR